MLATVISETLNVRSEPKVGNNVVGTLTKGQTVELKGSSEGAPRWAIVDCQGQDRFAARRLLAQKLTSPTVTLPAELDNLVSTVIWQTTTRYDRITYKLGCKAKGDATNELSFPKKKGCSGTTVDCSGWVSGLFQLLALQVNATTGMQVFGSQDVKLLSNHSDGQIVGVGNATGQIVSGTDIDSIQFRSGLIFGLNNGDYDWEGQERVFEIDHIVMGVTRPDGYYIT